MAKRQRVYGDVRLSKTRIAREIALLIGDRLTCGRHAKPLYVIDIFNRACRASFAVRLALQKLTFANFSERPLADLLRTKSKRPGTQSESAWRKQNARRDPHEIAVNRGAWLDSCLTAAYTCRSRYQTNPIVPFSFTTRKPIALEAWCFTDLYRPESFPQGRQIGKILAHTRHPPA